MTDTTDRRSFRIWLAEHLLHIGWAIMGQECHCGDNRFNWLARLQDEGQWTDDGEPANLWTSATLCVGEAFVNAYCRLMPKERT